MSEKHWETQRDGHRHQSESFTCCFGLLNTHFGCSLICQGTWRRYWTSLHFNHIWHDATEQRREISFVVTVCIQVPQAAGFLSSRQCTNLPVCVEGARNRDQVIMYTANRWGSTLILGSGDYRLWCRASSASSYWSETLINQHNLCAHRCPPSSFDAYLCSPQWVRWG